MSLQPVYLASAKNLKAFLEALRHAQAPEKIGLKVTDRRRTSGGGDRPA